MLCKLEQGVKSISIAIRYWFYICKFYIKRNTPWLAFALRKVRVVCPCVWNAPLTDTIETLGINKTRPTYLSKSLLLFVGILVLEIMFIYGTFFILAIRTEQYWNPQGHAQWAKDPLKTAWDMLFTVKANSGQSVSSSIVLPAESQVPDFILFRALEMQVIVRRESVSCGLESRKECISIFVITEFQLLIINIGLCLKPLSLASTTAHIVLNVKAALTLG